MRRRSAVLGGAAAAGLAGGWRWPGGAAPMPGRLLGANAALGHRLRDGGVPEPDSTTQAEVVIVGGGMAGLSAAWRLRKRGVSSIALLELEAETGGNAASGHNGVSAYPWGAHYVPSLTREAVHARELFAELGIITGQTPAGEPVYNDLFLCADPHERLYILGRWQDDLLPQLGVTEQDRQQYRAFFAAMDGFRAARGADGRRAFAIPVDLSASDAAFRSLDAVSMAEWMAQQGWASVPLRWYVDYCCKDDYGATAADVSAWAGIHYFAARDSRGQDDQPVLTWPQGNGYIAQQLARLVRDCIQPQSLAFRVRPGADGVAVDVFDPASGRSRRIQARAAVLAVPHFVAARLLGRSTDAAHSYAPWMVANVTLDKLPAGRGAPLSWDNVVYNSQSLGYVVATHQGLERVKRQTVLTYYWPLSGAPPDQARREAFARPLADWQAMVTTELLQVHPELAGAVRAVDVWLWGHGMIRPAPGYVWGPARAAACVQQPPVFFAHSDMSGISLFEEANYRGVLAADAVAEFLAA